jgi:hypothetical protein
VKNGSSTSASDKLSELSDSNEISLRSGKMSGGSSVLIFWHVFIKLWQVQNEVPQKDPMSTSGSQLGSRWFLPFSFSEIP